MTLGDFKESMADNLDWNSDEDVVERLVFRHRVGTNKDGSAKYKYIIDDDNYLWAMDRMRACELRVRYQGKTKTKDGDAIVRDVNCDSKYMDAVMPKVGKVRSQNLLITSSPARLIVASFVQAIREAYHFVDKTHPIFLYLDNAGGHGTDDCVTKYVKMLEEDYNVICVHQRPRSPSTNMLDLDV